MDVHVNVSHERPSIAEPVRETEARLGSREHTGRDDRSLAIHEMNVSGAESSLPLTFVSAGFG